MPYRKISTDLKERAIWLLQEGYIPDEAAVLLGVSERSIYRWRSNIENYNAVVRPPNPLHMPGRPQTLSAEITHDLVNRLTELPDLYLDEIQEWLAVTHDVPMSISALHGHILDCGITYKMLHKAAAERNEELRTEWREEHQQHWVGSQIVFVDETSKHERTSRVSK